MKMKTVWRLFKFHDPTNEISNAIKNGITIGEAIRTFGEKNFIGKEEWIGNVGLTAGIANLLDLACALAAPNAWSSTYAKLGVGDSATATDPSQTGLQAGTNHVAVAMDSTYPKRSGTTVTFQSTFAAGVGTWHWQEYVVTNNSEVTGTCLNRCLSDKGTKGSGDSWILQLQITVA